MRRAVIASIVVIVGTCAGAASGEKLEGAFDIENGELTFPAGVYEVPAGTSTN